jgi:sulfatase modifying factor 1
VSATEPPTEPAAEPPVEPPVERPVERPVEPPVEPPADNRECCAPVRGMLGESSSHNHLHSGGNPGPVAVSLTTTAAHAAREQRHTIAQATVPAQTFLMGDRHGDDRWGDGEGPAHPVTLAAFDIDTTSVTNGDFARFVEATGYRTEAESFGYSAVFHLVLAAEDEDVLGQPPGTPWWLGVAGADWRHPGGRHSSIEGLHEHPVTHISWNDAQAYCGWAGRRLPTEAEWECASRGGLQGARYPWGDERGGDERGGAGQRGGDERGGDERRGDERGENAGRGDEASVTSASPAIPATATNAANPAPSANAADAWRCNIWQGDFPARNTEADGFLTTSPVQTFEPNGYGLWQTVGNVWEWCADWYDAGFYAVSPAEDPRGPEHGDARVMRGGSFLCHDSYCNRYRNSARSSNTPDSSMANTGFRTVAL